MISYLEIERIRNSGLPATARHLLIELTYRAGKKGYCWPSIKTLAVDLGYSKRTISYYICMLKELKWIQKEWIVGQSTPNYHIRPLSAGMPDDPHADSAPPPMQILHPPPCRICTPPMQNLHAKEELKENFSVNDIEINHEKVKNLWHDLRPEEIPEPLLDIIVAIGDLITIQRIIVMMRNLPVSQQTPWELYLQLEYAMLDKTHSK